MTQNQQQRRQQLKAQGGSRPYTEIVTMSGDGADSYIPKRNDPEGRVLKLGGFDKLKVANKSSVDVVIYLDTNPKRAHYIEAGTQEIFSDLRPFRSWKVVGQGGSGESINLNELKITSKLSRLTADDQAAIEAERNAQNGGVDIGQLAGLANLLG